MEKRRLLYGLLVILWLLTLTVFYYVYHKPFSPSFAIKILRAIWQIAVGIGVITFAGGLGNHLVGSIILSPVTSLAMQAGLGLGFISIGILLIGTLIEVNIYIFLLLIIIVGIFLRRSIYKWWRLWRGLISLWSASGKFELLIASSIGLLFIFTLFVAIAPPLKFDTLVYHLTLPQIYINTSQIGYVREIVFWGMPQITEMLFLLAMLGAGTEAAIILGWMIGAFTILGVMDYTTRKLGKKAAWVSTGSLLAGYTVAASLAWGYVEWLSMLFGWSVIVMFDEWKIHHQIRYLLLAGVFTGFSLGTKQTAGVLVFAGLVIILLDKLNKKQNSTLSNILIYLITVILISCPWWLKNLLATGNPFYPFLIPGGEMTKFRLSFYQGEGAWGDWMDIFFLPLRATILGIEGTPGYSASIGPLLLGLGSLSWINWSIRPKKQKITITTSAIIVFVGVIAWIIASRFSGYLIQSRLYIPIFPALIILAGAGFQGVRTIKWPKIRFDRVVGVLVIIVLILNVFQVGVDLLSKGALQASMGMVSDTDYLTNNLGWFIPAMQSINRLTDDSKVLMLWEPRSLYCLPKCIPDEIIDRWAHDRFLYEEPNSILSSWKAEGYTHLLYYKTGADFIREEDERYTNSDWEALDQLLVGLPLIENFGDTYYLYAID